MKRDIRMTRDMKAAPCVRCLNGFTPIKRGVRLGCPVNFPKGYPVKDDYTFEYPLECPSTLEND